LTLAADGSYSYALNNSAANVQALGRVAVVTDTFAYTVNDDGSTPLSASSNLTITITGTNDGPQTVADVAAVSEDNVLSASGNVLANDNDVDVGDVLSVTTPGVFQGTYGDLTLSANGAYSYSLNNTAINVQNLRGGQQVSDSFAYTATDGLANANSALTITVTGKNDAPMAFADAAAVKEDTVIGATGNVLTNDTDPDQGTILSVTNAGVYAGQYGTLTLSVNGLYSYALNNSAANVQALAAGQVVIDQFSYAIQDDDAQPLTAASTLTLTITGTNDSPTVVAALATQAARERQVFSYTVPVGTFADVDNGDALTYSALAVNAAGGSQALPGWLRFNATTRTFSGTPGSSDGGSFDFQVTATDKLGASVSTRFTLDIADEYAGTGANINVINGNWTNDTLNGTSRSETIYGGGGTDRIFAGEGNNTVVSCGRDTYVTAGAGNDTITTSYGTDTIYAGDGTNKVNAGGGNNLVVTGSGDDTISTDWGFSNINAGAGNNTIMATGDATVVSTGAGNDNITTNYGNDTINAGDGNNTISAGGGNNRIAAGSGNDLITTGWGNSTIDAGDGANVITATGGNTVVTTGAGADRINTGSGNDTINSGAGNDVISASWGLDVINAGAGDDTITTGGGNDIVRAGLGNDTIIADQWSDDKYYYTRGDGRDTLTDGGGMDTLVLENIRSDQLWFTHVGNDLNVSVVGSSDGVTIKNWYTGLQYPGAQRHVEQFQTSDGKVLLDCQVQNLVNAMAAFAPPVAGETNLTGSAAATLAPVLAANWQ
jgi:VCBS repeat-containing protein